VEYEPRARRPSTHRTRTASFVHPDDEPVCDRSASKLYRSEVDWGYSTAPQAALDGRHIYFPRGKMLGGSSSINAQVAVRGRRADYDGWAARGNPGWAWNDVVPYFERSADGPFEIADLRYRNPLTAFVAAAVEAGIPRTDDLNAPEPEGVGHVQVSQRRGRRWSVADGYLRPALSRRNLTVCTGAHATRVLLEEGRAVAVAYRRDRRARRRRPRTSAHALPPCRHLSNGHRRGGRRRRRAPRSRPAGASRCRRLGDAAHPPWAHELADGDDRGEGSGAHPRRDHEGPQSTV